jgi:hypothetical protein
MPRFKTQGLVEQSGSSEDNSPIEKPLKTRRDEMSFSEEKWFFKVRVSFLVLASACSAISVFLFNILMPERWRWLSEGDLAKIKGLAITIIVGLIMSGATTYFFRRKS